MGNLNPKFILWDKQLIRIKSYRLFSLIIERKITNKALL